MYNFFKILTVNFLALAYSVAWAQTTETSLCEKTKNESIIKLNSLVAEIKTFSGLNCNAELATVILPEFISFSYLENLGELMYISINHQVNNIRFKTVSFGPFQMQLKFIDYYLINSDKSNLSDTILSGYIESNFDYLLDHIFHLNKLETQWEILNLYSCTVKKNHIEKISESELLSILIRIYNSGTTDISKNQKYFSKITCQNLSYEKWCYEINSWINEP